MSIQDLKFKCKTTRERHPDKDKLVYIMAELNDIEYLLKLADEKGDVNVEKNSGNVQTSGKRPEIPNRMQKENHGAPRMDRRDNEGKTENNVEGESAKSGTESSPNVVSE